MRPSFFPTCRFVPSAFVPSALVQSIWLTFLYTICALLLAPILFIIFIATGDTDGLLPHLFNSVLFTYIQNTLVLMVGVGGLSTLFGVATAWIITRYQFFMRNTLEWVLVLPAAMPAYIIAYSYTDFLEFAGPVQTFLRSTFGWHTSKDYWFPDIRSMGGAWLIMSSVLYPYIYLLARTAFCQTSTALIEVASLSGQNIFTKTVLPLARPAIIAGLSLVLMETVSDFGTVDYFAIDTLTLGIFNVWLGMNNIAIAAQLALCAFTFIGILLAIEIIARSRRSFQNQTAGTTGIPRHALPFFGQFLCWLCCFAPIFIGFILPVAILTAHVLDTGFTNPYRDIVDLAFQTLTLATFTAFLVITISLGMGIISYYKAGRAGRAITAAASTGYAFPGTILAIGVLGFMGFMDGLLSKNAPLFSGTILLLIFGLGVRFQAVGYGAITSGLKRMPPNMLESGRILGHGFAQTLRTIIIPLLRPSILAGGLLVFVDVMKELPMTLLLRPFSFETFATFTYQFAKDERLEIAAAPALLIILTGLLPVFIANRALKL